MAAKKFKTHCAKGHEFTPENTVIDSNGSRVCLECRRQRDRKGYIPRPRDEKGQYIYCLRGHELTPENTYIRPSNGQRVCLICKNSWKPKERANYEDIDGVCVNGHEYTIENTYINPVTGYRLCKLCRRNNFITLRQNTENFDRKRDLKKHYGLTLEEYFKKVSEQDSRCPVCNKIPEKGLVVDHDHNTGEVRDLLCGNCNSGLGFFKEDTEIMKRAILYLEKHKVIYA